MIHAFYLNHQCTDDNLKLSNLLLSQTQFKIVSSRANAENFCRFGRIHTYVYTTTLTFTVLTRLNPDSNSAATCKLPVASACRWAIAEQLQAEDTLRLILELQTQLSTSRSH